MVDALAATRHRRPRRTRARIAGNLGAELIELPIEEAMGAYESLARRVFAGREPDITEENVQARIRGNLLMALSNKFGWLVLTTGNKSELSVGYATLYGDMAGGFAVLKDVPRAGSTGSCAGATRRPARELVPANVLERPPSAELRYEQRDDQSLPPYDVLDPILEGYVELDLDADELVRRGLPPEDVERVIRLVDLAEYKRRQAPPGVRISTKAFGRDRRLPITNRYESRVQEDGGRSLAAAARALARRPASAGPPSSRALSRTGGPSSSVKSTSQTHVVRPLWRRRASAWIVPLVIGRRKFVLLDMPVATCRRDRPP